MERSLVLFACVVAACGDPGDDVSTTHDAGHDSSSPAVGDVGDFDSASFGFDSTPRDTFISETPPDAPAPPARSCSNDGDASDDAAAECPPPPSVCTDAWWLAYYTNGRCVGGACAFDVENIFCERGCDAGGCLPFSTK